MLSTLTSIPTLHILNKAPEHPRAVACGRSLKPGDTLLLTENAVLALADNTYNEETIEVYALAPDVLSRGLSNCAQEAVLVNFTEMVELTAQAQNMISW